MTKQTIAFAFALLFMMGACKKDDKDDVQSGYSLKLISGFETDTLGKNTSTPVVVQLLKDGKPVGLNTPNFVLTIVDNTCRISNDYPYSYSNTFNPDGTASIHWYTGEKTGVQPVKIQLSERNSNPGVLRLLTSLDFSFNIIPNQTGWVPTCKNNSGFLLKLKGNKVLFFTENTVSRSIDNGKSWVLLHAFPNNINSYNQNGSLIRYKHFIKYVPASNAVYLYTKSPNGRIPQEEVIYKSTDDGSTWTSFGFTGSYYHMDVAKDSTLIVSESSGLWAIDTLFKPWKKLIPAGGFTEFEEASNGNCFALDMYGEIFKATSLYETYTKLALTFKPDNLFVVNDVLYAFEKNNVYKSTNFGASFTPLGNFTNSSEVLAERLDYHNGTFYIIFSSQRSGTSQIVTTRDWMNYQPLNNSLNTPEPNYSYPNFAIGDDGSLLIQQQNNFFQYKP